MDTRARNLTWLPLFVALSLPPSGCGIGLAGRGAPATAAAPGDTSVRSMLIVAKTQEGEGAVRPAPYGPPEPRQEREPFGLVPEPLACLVHHDCFLPVNLHAS
jgi:hypothetical protein